MLVQQTKGSEDMPTKNSNYKSYSFTALSAEELDEIIGLALSEKATRSKKAKEAEKAKKRENWVNKMFCNYLHHPNANSLNKGEFVVVAVYNRYNGLRMGTARPVKGDKYDHKVGIAVAFAKACGEPVPDYI